MASRNRKAHRKARKWARKAFKALRRAGVPRPVAKAGANNVGKAAFKSTRRRSRRGRRY